jgi:subtilisin family serine protease
LEDEIMKRFLSGLSLAAMLIVIPVVGFAADARYIVKFNAGRSDAGQAALHGMGAQIVLSLDPQGAVAALIPERALPGLAHNPNIEYIEVDEIRTPMATWSDRPVGSEILPFGIQMVQADLVTSSHPEAKRVCIIDSGYSQQHEDLRDDPVGDDSITQNATNTGSGTWDQDSCGHGSHVAGTIMATAGNSTGVIGVIPGVRLHIVKVFGDDNLSGGNCSWTYSSTLVNALNKCQVAGSNITSMSLGGSRKTRTEDVAFSDTYKQGMLHVAAAGNAGNKTTSYPAGYASVISVAAVDANETVANFSQQNRDVEIAAPGVGVLSTVPWIDYNTLTFPDATNVSGLHIEFSARTTIGVTGGLVNGGLCDSTGSWSGKVVLCQRGSIDFLTKVQNVKNGGGVAAVIYNNVTSDPTCGDFAGTLGEGNSSTIPAIGVSCDDGTYAFNYLGPSGTVFSQLTVNASGYEAWNGTSMATPHVSGVAALIWSCYPGLTNQKVRDTMNATAKPAGAAGRDNAYGYGIVQAKAAVDSLIASPGLHNCTTSEVSKY